MEGILSQCVHISNRHCAPLILFFYTAHFKYIIIPFVNYVSIKLEKKRKEKKKGKGKKTLH